MGFLIQSVGDRLIVTKQHGLGAVIGDQLGSFDVRVIEHGAVGGDQPALAIDPLQPRVADVAHAAMVWQLDRVKMKLGQGSLIGQAFERGFLGVCMRIAS